MTDRNSQDQTAAFIRDYDAQGEHRCGSDVDMASAHWLASSIESFGAEPNLIGFDMARVNQEVGQLAIDGEVFEGSIQYDGGQTSSEGVTGTMGRLGSHHPIGVRLPEHSASALMEARQSGGHVAIISVARQSKHAEEGMALPNAPAFDSPFGPPVLHLPPEAVVRIEALIGAETHFVASASRTPTQAFNVEVRIRGSDASLAPLVVLTARSGWWQCASERGTGLAVWLNSLGAVQSARCRRDVRFIATTGHELGHIGLKHAMKSLDDSEIAASTWIHIGASIGAAFGACLWLQASDTDLATMAENELRDAGASLDRKRPVGDPPTGEASSIFKHRARYVSVLSPNALLRHQADRWPEAVDIGRTEPIAQAIAQMCISAAN